MGNWVLIKAPLNDRKKPNYLPRKALPAEETGWG